jgi:hypothetical protein
MADHDSLYHRLFDHPFVVAELLREFLADVPLDGLDLDGMTRENARFHASTGDRRDGDMVWRIPRRDGGETYLLLLLEFQSRSDRWMALRVLVYAGLLWQHLVTEKRLPTDGRLPPILPVVLHNGDLRWAAPLALHDLIGLPGDSPLWRWQPSMRYQIVDEGAFSEDDLARRDALLALLFRLENSPDPAQVVVLADAVLAWFRRHPAVERVRPIFVEMLGAMLVPLAPGVRVPDELLEVRSMLATRWEVWERKRQEELQEAVRSTEQSAQQKGRQEGRQQGRQEGRQEGEAALLRRLLERRFGALPDWARDRIAAADTAALEDWSLRLLDASSLEDVLA